jgi:hypothetical protein
MASVEGSITGVPVIPSGLIFPHGSDEAWTGRPTACLDVSFPVVASKA